MTAAAAPDIQAQSRRLQEAVADVRGPEERTPADPDQQQLESEAYTGLRARQLSTTVPVCEELAIVFPKSTKLQKVVELIHGGVQPELCARADAHKALEPRQEPKVRGGRRALREAGCSETDGGGEQWPWQLQQAGAGDAAGGGSSSTNPCDSGGVPVPAVGVVTDASDTGGGAFTTALTVAFNTALHELRRSQPQLLQGRRVRP